MFVFAAVEAPKHSASARVVQMNGGARMAETVFIGRSGCSSWRGDESDSGFKKSHIKDLKADRNNGYSLSSLLLLLLLLMMLLLLCTAKGLGKRNEHLPHCSFFP